MKLEMLNTLRNTIDEINKFNKCENMEGLEFEPLRIVNLDELDYVYFDKNTNEYKIKGDK